MKTLLDLGLVPENASLQCARIADCFGVAIKKYGNGEMICGLGALRHDIGILCSGSAVMARIDIDGGIHVLERLEEGGIFGEFIAFSSLPGDTLSVIAEGECEALLLPHRKIMQPCSNSCDCHHILLENLFALISRKTQILSERVEILSRRSIQEKLLCYFRITATKTGSLTFQLPFSLSDLADYICTDRSAMMRQLKKLRETSLITVTGRQITLNKMFNDTLLEPAEQTLPA